MTKTKKTKEYKKKGSKKQNDGAAIPKFVISFYTKERWQNWINQVKEIDFDIDAQDKYSIFVNMSDDVILSCLKIIAKYDKDMLQKDDANKHLQEIKEIVLQKIGPINDSTDAMLESIQFSLIGVFASFQCYIDKKFERTKSFAKLIDDAISAENKNDMETALNNVAIIGANIIAGEKLSDDDLNKMSTDGPVAEWLDGIDSIYAAMIGDTSYRDDEPDTGD